MWRRRSPARAMAFSSLLVFLLVLLRVPGGPADVLSSNQKAASERVPQISPMGAIARGDEPVPDIEALFRRAGGLQPAPRAPLGLQGNDRLVHSPTAIDFQSETTIARYGDSVVVGYNDIRGFSLSPYSVSGYSYSADGGLTWTDGGQLPTIGGAGEGVYGDPDLKAWKSPQDTVYFFYSSLYTTPAGNNSLCLHVSTDGGATWSLPREVTTATSSTDFPDKEYMDVDPETGRIFITWTNFGFTTTMRATYSDDFGLTWHGPSTIGSSAFAGSGSIPRTDGSNTRVYAAWRTSSTVRFVTSTNNGTSWGGVTTAVSGLSEPLNPYGSDRIHGFPGMDVDDNNGNIYIVYASRNLAPDFSDIYFIRSVNGGSSWSNPVAINANPGSDGAQYFPWVSVDQSDGRIDVIWYDQINASGTSDITDVFHTHSSDGGLTWTCPTPLTDKPFHAEYGNTTSQPNMGDYNQCVSDNGVLSVSFAKTGEPSPVTYAPDTYVDISEVTPVDAPISFVGLNFTDTGCNTNNGYIETGETVNLYVTIGNYSDCVDPITGIQGTLTSSTPGVLITTGVRAFGNLGGAGSTAANALPFVFDLSAGFSCGDDVDLLLTISSSAGTALVPFRMASGTPSETVLLSENFDGVTAPALPAGWSTVRLTGTTNNWTTSTTYAASSPNAAYCADISTTSLNELDTPTIPVPGSCDLLDVTFDITHDIEDDATGSPPSRKAWDGALLRVLINGSQVPLAGAFASHFDPFYPWQMNRQSSSSQPLQDLACWSSDVTPNFNSVHLQFPGLAGTNIKLLFDMSTDAAVGTPTGMFVDNVVVKSIELTCECAAGTLAVDPPALNFGSAPGNETTCDSVRIINTGTATVHIDSIVGCSTPPFSIDTTGTSHTLAPGDTAKFAVCVTPTVNDPDTCTVTIFSDASNDPVTVSVSMDIPTAIGDLPSVPFEITGVVPNPFNPSTTVRFNLPGRMPVTAEVWSVAGARVRVLAEGRVFPAGANALVWDGKSDGGAPVASGVYFVRVKTHLGVRVTRAVLLK